MKVFTDLHHFDLFYSFQLVFEKRFGWDLYRPIGYEWRDEKFWDLNHDPDFISCMLSTENGECERVLSRYNSLAGKDWAVYSLHLPRIGEILEVAPGKFEVEDRSKHCSQKAITLEAFKNEEFDIIISSLPQHFSMYQSLIKKYQPKAKHVFHVSGIGCQVPADAKNVMLNSSTDQMDNLGIHSISYRQEFDLDVFQYRSPVSSQVVRSYVHFPQTEELWRRSGLDWDFKFVGKTLGPLADVVVDSVELAKEIANSSFTLHIKPGGESYGHILHNSFAVGRPVIINKADFNGVAKELFTEDTCIDVSNATPEEFRKKIGAAANTDRHAEMCEKVAQQFSKVVSFDEDAEQIMKFIQGLR